MNRPLHVCTHGCVISVNFLRHSYRNAPKYKFGYQIPSDYKEAMKFDELNRNDRWDRSVKAEMQQLDDYHCFIDAGIYGRDSPPTGYKKI
jgi:hypothetical protein